MKKPLTLPADPPQVGRDFPADADSRRIFRYDVWSAVLFVAVSDSLVGLFAFIARISLGASVEWVGIISSAGYIGFTWNLFLARFTARLSLRRGIMLAMTVCAGLIALASLQRGAVSYSLLIILFLLVHGLYQVQYNTLIGYVYGPGERPRLLSQRQLAIAAVSAVQVAIFGWMCKGTLGHLPAFLIGAALMLAGAAVFRAIPIVKEHPMEPFHPLDVGRAALRNAAFRRMAIILTSYGWVGAGIGPVLVLLFQRCGFQEDKVGLLVAIKTGGLLLGLLVITPRLRFAGGITNFRLSFIGATFAVACYLITGFVELGELAFWVLGIGQFLFGISLAGFNIALPTTGINLATAGQTTLYVNAIMIVLGLRGMLMPLVVASSLRVAGLELSLLITMAVAIGCSVIVLIPGIDAMTGTGRQAPLKTA